MGDETLRAGVLAFDASGQPVSPLYGDVYKSRSGALGEAREVFLGGAAVESHWVGRRHFTVVELGFGLGVNFLATLAAWRANPHRPARLHYVAVERHPLPAEALRTALAALSPVDPRERPAGDVEALLAAWPMALPGLHRMSFAGGAVTLTLAFGDALAVVPRLALAADAFYLDGFAPARNPRMWDPALFKALARLARPGATVATYSAAHEVRDALAAAGFDVALQPGYGGKRHRLSGRYAPRWRTYAPPAEPPEVPVRRAVVVGAGLAGCAAAAALAGRGWQVTVLEARERPVSEGSAQPVIADHLHLSPDDNALARLSRAALLLGRADRSPGASGRLQLAESPADRERQAAMLARLEFPEAFAQVLPADAASSVAGVRLPHGGLWLPLAGAADPTALCASWLATAAPGVRTRLGVRVDRLAHDAGSGLWQARDAHGAILAEAPVVVLANAGDAMRLGRQGAHALRRVRGQTTRLEHPRLAGLKVVLGGDAYACPLPQGGTLVGATFDDGETLVPDPLGDLGNLRRLARALACEVESLLPGAAPAAVGFRFTALDRLPLVGALPDEALAGARATELARNDRLPLPVCAGLYGAFAFGSRGLLWARLGAEVLAATIDGGPLPIEADLQRALDPARFLRARLRRGRLP